LEDDHRAAGNSAFGNQEESQSQHFRVCLYTRYIIQLNTAIFAHLSLYQSRRFPFGSRSGAGNMTDTRRYIPVGTSAVEIAATPLRIMQEQSVIRRPTCKGYTPCYFLFLFFWLTDQYSIFLPRRSMSRRQKM
jgi:hypothetical protein